MTNNERLIALRNQLLREERTVRIYQRKAQEATARANLSAHLCEELRKQIAEMEATR